ncbi:MAG: hypothetical protein AAGL66_05030 [Pseudomonadota bacterium]
MISARRAAWIALLALCIAHLAITAIEIFHRPIFPWDAWLNWMYRAKAWYLSGAVAAMDPVALWASGQTPEKTYAVAGHHYPTLLPLIAYGVARVIGSWSETLVNLPFLLCCVALPGGSYLIARWHGYSRFVAMVCAYFVFSIPLIGAHLSLAGQADIWMASTTGLGFALLCSGLIHQRIARTAGGLILIAIGTQFKVEGFVWLLAGILLTALSLRPRLTLTSIALLVLVSAILGSVGIDYLNIPLLGTLGVQDGRLYVPLMGSYALQQYELGDDYLDNFLLGGSWNLLWYLVLAAILVSAFRARENRSARIGLAFFVVAAAAQVMIFFFTEQGAWAEDWTAINRLPLHFVPALVFVSLLMLWPAERIADHESMARVGVAMIAGLVALLVLASSTATLLSIYANKAAIKRDGAAMRAVIGAGKVVGSTQSIARFDNNVALLSSGRVAINAGDASVARIATSGNNRSESTIWWRTGGDDSLHSQEFAGTGIFFVDLSESSEWQGQITEFGLVFYDDGGTVALESLALYQPGPALWLRRILADWRWVAPWSQRSVHWLAMGNPDAAMPFSLALVTVFVLAAGGTALIFKSGQRLPVVAVVFLVVWVLYDLSWIHQRSVLAGRTIQSYTLANSQALAFGDDQIGRSAVRRALCDLVDNWSQSTKRADELPRLLIAGNSDSYLRFQILRAKYHALPVSAYAHERSFASLPATLADRVLVLKLRYGQENATLVSSEDAANLFARARGQKVRLAWEDEHAFLLVTGENVGNAACWQQST